MRATKPPESRHYALALVAQCNPVVRDELRLAIFNWIERDYVRRRQARPDRFTPIEFEMVHNAALAA